MPNKQNGIRVFLLMIVLTILMVFSLGFVFELIPFLNLQTAPGVSDNITITVDSNWSDEGTLNGLETDSDIIYPASDSDGNWSSDIYDFPRNRVLRLSYDADMRDGNGYILIKAWDNDPANSSEEPSTFRRNLSSGFEEVDVGFEEKNYFQTVVYLEETSGSNNNRPNLDSLVLDFEILDEEKVGLGSEFKYRFIFILMFYGFLSLILMSYSYWRYS